MKHILQCAYGHILQYRTYYNVQYTMHTTCTCYSAVLYMSYGHILQYSNTYYNTEHTTMYYIQCILHAHATVQYYTCHMDIYCNTAIHTTIQNILQCTIYNAYYMHMQYSIIHVICVLQYTNTYYVHVQHIRIKL